MTLWPVGSVIWHPGGLWNSAAAGAPLFRPTAFSDPFAVATNTTFAYDTDPNTFAHINTPSITRQVFYLTFVGGVVSGNLNVKSAFTWAGGASNRLEYSVNGGAGWISIFNLAVARAVPAYDVVALVAVDLTQLQVRITSGFGNTFDCYDIFLQ